MSRSLKDRHERRGFHTTVVGYISNKKDKQLANRRFRTHNRMGARLSTILAEDAFKKHHIRQVSDNWCFSSDGTKYFRHFQRNNRWWCGKDFTKEEIKLAKRK